MSRTSITCAVAALLAVLTACRADGPPPTQSPQAFETSDRLWTTPPDAPSGRAPSYCDMKPEAEDDRCRVSATDPLLCQPFSTTSGPVCSATQPAMCCMSGTASGSAPACCLQATPAIGYMTLTVAAPAQKSAIDAALERLEALKARKDAIEREEREAHAVLAELLKAQQERMNKLGLGSPTPVQAPAVSKVPAGYYYEPVTSYRTAVIKDAESGTQKHVVTPVTTYILRKKAGTAGEGLPAPMPHSVGVVPPSPKVETMPPSSTGR